MVFLTTVPFHCSASSVFPLDDYGLTVTIYVLDPTDSCCSTRYIAIACFPPLLDESAQRFHYLGLCSSIPPFGSAHDGSVHPRLSFHRPVRLTILVVRRASFYGLNPSGYSVGSTIITGQSRLWLTCLAAVWHASFYGLNKTVTLGSFTILV